MCRWSNGWRSARGERAGGRRPDGLGARAQRENLQLPGYSNFRLIVQGGEGSVYRARQDGLGRDVAVKVLRVEDAATLARFRRELEITVRLGRQHPHIVTVLDTGTLPDGRPCIVMEHYDLGSLHDRLRARGPLPVAEVVAEGMAVADALAFANAQGFLHRDVKPQNIFVLPTSYVLADFGWGCPQEPDTGVSCHEGVILTVARYGPRVGSGSRVSNVDDRDCGSPDRRTPPAEHPPEWATPWFRSRS